MCFGFYFCYSRDKYDTTDCFRNDTYKPNDLATGILYENILYHFETEDKALSDIVMNSNLSYNEKNEKYLKYKCVSLGSAATGSNGNNKGSCNKNGSLPFLNYTIVLILISQLYEFF